MLFRFIQSECFTTPVLASWHNSACFHLTKTFQPAGKSALVCAEGLSADLLKPLAAGAPVAASLPTLDVVSFQAKGRWLGRRRLLGAPVGTMAVTAVYAGGPPIPGRQVA